MKRHVQFAAASLVGFMALWVAGRKAPEERARKGWLPIGCSVGLVAILALSILSLQPSHDAAIPLLRKYGCAGCHSISATADGDGTVGPPLVGLATRTFVAGGVRNEPGGVAA